MTGRVHPMAYFEEMYAGDPDPWGFDHRPYEQRKHALTVALLPAERYRRAIEPGCANGALTERLAAVCDRIDAFDPVDACVSRARERLRSAAGVSVRRGLLPDDWPAGEADLVVLSEVAYYLSDDASTEVLDAIQASLVATGTLVAVHWTGPTNYPRTAEQVHGELVDLGWLQHRAHLRDEGFVADVWTRA